MNAPMTAHLFKKKLLEGAPFTLIDVGCAGGIDSCWRQYEPYLRAFGLDPQSGEIDRLSAAEKNEAVSYQAYYVGVEDDHPFLERCAEQRADAARERFFSPWDRVSMRTAQEIRAQKAKAATELRTQSNSLGDRMTDRKISVDRFVDELGLATVDFIKIDTDGQDFEVLQSARKTLESRQVLALMVECPFTGTADDTANSFHNIDRYLRQFGFQLFTFEPCAYSRAQLPYPFKYALLAQTTNGQVLWADALYVRDGGSPDFEAVCDTTLSAQQVLKLASVLEVFDLSDCAAEVIQRHAVALAAVTDTTRLLDALVPEVAGRRLRYVDYVGKFREQPDAFFPGGEMSQTALLDARWDARADEVVPPTAEPAVAPAAFGTDNLGDVVGELTVVEVPGVFSLASSKSHHVRAVSGKGPISVTTSSRQWWYALEVPVNAARLLAIPRGAVGLDIRVRLEVQSGQVGIGVVKEDGQTYVAEVVEPANKGVETVATLPLQTLGSADRLILRNCALNGVVSRFVVSEVSLFAEVR
jgi:FkbM family methyltransferase